eukprot:5819720-Pyramimonas_sp.AAC.1
MPEGLLRAVVGPFAQNEGVFNSHRPLRRLKSAALGPSRAALGTLLGPSRGPLGAVLGPS